MSKTVLQIVVIVCCVCWPVAWPCAAYGAAKGPLRVQNRHPLYLMFLTPEPDSPRLIEKEHLLVSVSADYTSLYIDEANSEWSALMDMEMTVMDLSLSYGLSSRLNIGMTFPWISMNDGFLDGPLEDYHGFTGFPDYGKDKGPVDEFGYGIFADDKPWLDAESGGLHLGDSVVSIKVQMIDARQGLASSLQTLLKIPTGDSKHGFGSGRPDAGIVMLNRYGISPLAFYLNPGYVLLSDPETQGADVQVRDIMTLLMGIEYQADDTWSLLGQINAMSSPLGNTGIAQMDENSLELAMGLCASMSNSMVFEFAFCEDLTRTAPDFTVHAAVRWEIDL